MKDYFRTEGEMPDLLPDHVVVGSSVAIDLGNQTLADGTPVNVTRTTTDTMMPKRMISPGVPAAEKNEHKRNVDGHKLSHMQRIELLNPEQRAHFDETYDMMREDFRNSYQIRKVEETLLEKAGIPEFVEFRDDVPAYEMFGKWFNRNGQLVDSPQKQWEARIKRNQFDHQYNENMRNILATGEERIDRTGVGTLMKFGTVVHHIDLREGFPATTGKKFAFKTMKGETIDWMLKGLFDLKSLKDLGIRIWDQNVKPGTEVYEYKDLCIEERVKLLTPGQLESFKEFREGLRARRDVNSLEYEEAFDRKFNNWGVPDTERVLVGGDLGKIYGKQWRAWEDTREIPYHEWVYEKIALEERGFKLVHFVTKTVGNTVDTTHAVIKREIDQIAAIETAIQNELKFHRGEIDKHSEGRRIILTGWNVAQLDEMSLPPCHTLAQWSVSQTKDENGRNFLDCELYQRSNDMFLGCPFNVAQYALITEMLAHAHGLTARGLHHTIGDAHIYKNHIEEVKELLARPIEFNSPKLVIKGEAKSILDITSDQVSMVGYQSHEAFKGVPIAK